MNKISFSKYHGTGNDFIIIDNRTLGLPRKNQELYAALCKRYFGIGADGLILVQEHEEYDFEMVYFNSDGRESSMCGNGGRCVVRFVLEKGIIKNKDNIRFWAIDGLHKANLNHPIHKDWIQLKMTDVETVSILDKNKNYVLNTGSPHYVQFFEHDVSIMDVVRLGREINEKWEKDQGERINVNFAHRNGNQLNIRTYERGVENETYSCGTGVVATAIASALSGFAFDKQPVTIKTNGGNLQVKFEQIKDRHVFKNVWLCGPATHVFDGTIVDVETFL